MMSESYKRCDDCGKRALRIATRCPGCGRALVAPEVAKESPTVEMGRRVLSPTLMAAVAAAAVVVLAAEIGPGSLPGDDLSSPVAAADSVAAYSEAAYAIAAAVLPDSASATTVRAVSPGELRVAPTWTHVRKARTRKADLEAVLTPGDTVFADSLDKGWYRVALEGEVLGYAHSSTLTALAAQPAKGVRPGT